MAESLIFTGDLGLTSSFISTEKSFSGELLEELHSADALCINLELPFRAPGTKMAPYTHPSLYSPVEKAGELALLRPSVVNTGTNHCMDGGKEGLLLTRDTLSRLGIASFGTGMSEADARTPEYIDIGGKRFGFLSYCKKGNFTASSNRAGAALLSMENLEADIPEAAEKCDHLVVCLHMGMEFSKSVHPMYRELAHAAARLGASCVIGHHPHVIQGIETYRGVPIFYSLGNFLFDNHAGAVTYRGHWEDRHRGILARVNFHSDSVSFEVIPIIYESRPLAARIASGEDAAAMLREVAELSEAVEKGTDTGAAETEAFGAIARREIATIAVLTRIHGLRFIWYFLKDLKPRHFRMLFRSMAGRMKRK